MKYFFSLCLWFCAFSCLAQTPYVKYDPTSKVEPQTIPFDKPFYLEISPFQGGSVNEIIVFWIGRKEGKKKYKDNNPFHPKRIRSSFPITNYSTPDKNKLLMLFPALKPEREFRIQIRGENSTGNARRFYALLHQIHNLSEAGRDISSDCNLDSALQILKDSVNRKVPDDLDQIPSLYYTASQIDSAYYSPAKSDFRILVDTTNASKGFVTTRKFLTQANLTAISNAIDNEAPMAGRLFHAQKILDDQSIDSLMLGLLPYNYKNPAKATNSFDFNNRLKNLLASKSYFDSLLIATSELKTKHQGPYIAINDTIKSLYHDLDSNYNKLSEKFKAIRKYISPKRAQITNLFDGTTVSADLQTVSKRRFTLEAGVTSMWVYNALNQSKSLIKPFIGVTYHFRPTDKSVHLNKLPKPSEQDTIYSHALESRYNFLQRFSVTLGLTLGSISNKDFENVYGTFSFLLGPSFRVSDGVRISGGVSMVKRITGNPLLSDKKVTLGSYVSLSLDYDLLDVVKV